MGLGWIGGEGLYNSYVLGSYVGFDIESGLFIDQIGYILSAGGNSFHLTGGNERPNDRIFLSTKFGFLLLAAGEDGNGDDQQDEGEEGKMPFSHETSSLVVTYVLRVL
jgi:hypothetical protein